MTPQHFILATAGHVDHGKSALVKALTGTDPDRLPEEKARGITIDLGFAHLELPGTKQDERFVIGIVDVPGHEDFVKNMVAGVGSIDTALLVVAADDGWMPQTEEHLQILSYLGVRHGVVALTKIDLATSEEAIEKALREKLLNSPLAEAPIVRTSTITNRGIEELKTTLSEVLSRTPPPRDIGKPRLPVDRVFTLKGIGTVVTGTLTGGVFQRGQAVTVQPSGKATRIRNLQSHNRDVERSLPGSRTALNLPDISAAGQPGDGIQRGNIVTLPDAGEPSDTLDVLLEKSSRLKGGQSAAARPLKEGARVRVHLGSTNVAARVYLIDHGQLGPGEQRLAQLRLESPVFAFAGDRFIIRDWPEQATLAGGIILDPTASRRRFHTPARKEFLEPRARDPLNASGCVSTELARAGITRPESLLRQSRFSSSEIAEALKRSTREGKAVAVADLAADAAWWQAVVRQAADAIDTEHRTHPERPGLPLNQLRSAVEKNLPSPDLFQALARHLARNGFTQSGAFIKRTGHRPALPPHLAAAGNRLRNALSAKPFEPPSRKELAPDALSQQALRFLKETGETVELSDEVVLLAESFARMRDTVVQHIQSKGPATVSDLRQKLGTTRRIMMPFLERLDREGTTVRQGDLRSLRSPAKPPGS